MKTGTPGRMHGAAPGMSVSTPGSPGATHTMTGTPGAVKVTWEFRAYIGSVGLAGL